MDGYNKVVLVGNSTDEPQKFVTKSGKPVAAFSLAVNRTWKDIEGKFHREVDFHRIVAFGKWAEYIPIRVQKGKALLVEGQIVNRSFENAEGKKQFRTEVKLQKMRLLGQKKPEKKDSAPVDVEEEEKVLE